MALLFHLLLTTYSALFGRQGKADCPTAVFGVLICLGSWILKMTGSEKRTFFSQWGFFGILLFVIALSNNRLAALASLQALFLPRVLGPGAVFLVSGEELDTCKWR